MKRHPIDILKAALQEAKTEAATLRIKTATLAKERNVVIEERNKARARVKELEQQNAVQRENADEAMRQNTRLWTEVERLRNLWNEATTALRENSLRATTENPLPLTAAVELVRNIAVEAVTEQTEGTAPASDNAPFRQLEPDALTRIRELEAEVQRLQQDRAQVGAFGFKPTGIR